MEEIEKVEIGKVHIPEAQLKGDKQDPVFIDSSVVAGFKFGVGFGFGLCWVGVIIWLIKAFFSYL